MKGIDHYKLAEQYAAEALAAYDPAAKTALAQVHATLALAAATSDATQFRKDLYEGNGEPAPETVKRRQAAADKSAKSADLYL